MSLHADLAERAIEEYEPRLLGIPRVSHDALTLELDNGVVLQARFASDSEYSIQWRRDDAEQRIDTAPLHPGLASYPNHRHTAEGTVCADNLTRIDRSPWENLLAVLQMLLKENASAPLDAG